jgi:hypothetical protein
VCAAGFVVRAIKLTVQGDEFEMSASGLKVRAGELDVRAAEFHVRPGEFGVRGGLFDVRLAGFGVSADGFSVQKPLKTRGLRYLMEMGALIAGRLFQYALSS